MGDSFKEHSHYLRQLEAFCKYRLKLQCERVLSSVWHDHIEGPTYFVVSACVEENYTSGRWHVSQRHPCKFVELHLICNKCQRINKKDIYLRIKFKSL